MEEYGVGHEDDGMTTHTTPVDRVALPYDAHATHDIPKAPESAG